MMELIIFYFAAVAAVGGALMMILQRNPVASVLYLIVSLVALAVLFVQLNAIFVGALLIIVYAGAILVLFLFVIMLLNLRGEKFTEKRPRMDKATRLILAVVFFAELVIIIKEMAFPQRMNSLMVQASPDFGTVRPVAELLYTKYIYPFELTSILLLVAIVGAVVMARKDKSEKEGDS
ncbi:MAG: NADH-quinone oxidoreductase subunit J [candidate division Zixibacteria bacterium]|nr:NADH-quinone oxidoreductase subunit J [candidate division Zixibacteria bacterium]